MLHNLRQPAAPRPRHAIKGIVGLLVVAVLALAGAQSAYARAPQPGVSCTGQSECEALARRCSGSFVAVIVRDASGAPRLLDWCESTMRPRLLCTGASDCQRLKEICLTAKGSYTETTTGDIENPKVDGRCTLPTPPPKTKATIACDDDVQGDCLWLSGFCTGVKGTYTPPNDDNPFGACTWTPRTADGRNPHASRGR